MVLGFLKIEETRKVKNNPYYGNYEVKSEYTQTITNQRYTGLVSPQKGIVIKFTNIDGNKLTVTISKYAFTGERAQDYDKDCPFSATFCFNGHVCEVTVNYKGELITLHEWYNLGDFEDDIIPDSRYTTKSRGIKWELIDC